MIKNIASAIILIVAGSLPLVAQTATCSCAGVPLLNAIDVSSTQPGDFFFNLTTEQHEISDLVRGKKEISDETNLARSSSAQTVSMSYGLADKWSLSGLISYIEHTRDVGSSFFGAQRTSGLGDAVVLVRYTPLYQTPFSRHEVGLGLGARLPIGKDDATVGGFIASEDMHPSTGSIGKIAWASYSYAFDQAATMQLTASINYTLNDDENDRDYAFGDEFNFSLGFSQSIGTKFGYSAGLNYRTTTADERGGFDIPNTGGEWLDFVPAVRYQLTDNLTAAISGRVPIARELDGAIQFTTSYSYALSLTYAL